MREHRMEYHTVCRCSVNVDKEQKRKRREKCNSNYVQFLNLCCKRESFSHTSLFSKISDEAISKM